MKIFVVSDVHLDAVTAGVSRFEEISGLLMSVAERAVEESADAFFFLGDLCDPDSGPDVLRILPIAMHAIRKLDRAGVDSYWLAGNHDVVEDGRGTTTLDPLRGHYESAVVVTVPTISWNDNVAVCWLPFVERAANYDPEATVRDFYAKTPSAKAHVVAGHLNLEGISPGSETTDMARGRDVFFPIDAATKCAPAGSKVLLMNGHYHRQQVYRGVHVPGSLARLRFDEESHDPGYLVIDTEKLA